MPPQDVWKFTMFYRTSPLGPLPCSHSTSSLDHSQQDIGYRWPCAILGWLVLHVCYIPCWLVVNLNYRVPILLSGKLLTPSEFFNFSEPYVKMLGWRCLLSGEKKFPSSSPCTWISLLNPTIPEETNHILFALLNCVFIPESVPRDAFAISNWMEFQYPIHYYIAATLKQIG